MSVISNVISAGGTIAGLLPCAFLLVISAKTQFLDEDKINFTSQLIEYLNFSKNYLNVLVE